MNNLNERQRRCRTLQSRRLAITPVWFSVLLVAPAGYLFRYAIKLNNKGEI